MKIAAAQALARARPRGRAGRGRRRLCRAAAALWARLHHPRAVRSAADLRRSRAPSPRRRWTAASRAGPSSTWRAYRAELAARLDPTANSLQLIFEQVRDNPKRVVFAEGEEEKVDPRRARLPQRRLRHARPGRPRGADSHAMKAAGLGEIDGLEIHNARALPAQQALHRLPLPAAAAQGLALPRLPAHGEPGPQRLRRLHGGAGRRRRHGERRDAQLRHHASTRSRACSTPSRASGCSASRSSLSRGAHRVHRRHDGA